LKKNYVDVAAHGMN